MVVRHLLAAGAPLSVPGVLEGIRYSRDGRYGLLAV
jgi:hypothetical protein